MQTCTPSSRRLFSCVCVCHVVWWVQVGEVAGELIPTDTTLDPNVNDVVVSTHAHLLLLTVRYAIL